MTAILKPETRPGTGVVFTAGPEAIRMVRQALYHRLKVDFPDLTQTVFSELRSGSAAPETAVSMLEKLSSYTYLDPAAGRGVFLNVLHRELMVIQNLYRNGPDPDWLNERICGIDVDPAMINHCRRSLPFRPHLRLIDFLTAEITSLPDIIIANPPYVRQELLRPEYKSLVVSQARRDWPGLPVSARSDLYLYFILRVATVLNRNGVMTVIVPNGWLDNDFGAGLRQLFRSGLQLVELSDNGDARHFSVDVNTIIFTAVKQPVDRRRLVAIDRGDAIRQVQQEELAATPLGWYGTFFRCPDWLRPELLSNPRLIPLGEQLSVKTGIITGNNRKYYRRTPDDPGWTAAIRSPKETAAIEFYRNQAGNWLQMENVPFRLRQAPLLWTDLRGGRHLVVWNRDNLPFEHTFYGLTPLDRINQRTWALLLNSTWIWLMVELFGRKSLGGGAVRLVKSDLLKIPLPRSDSLVFPADLDGFLRRPIGNWPQELEQPDRQAIDAIVFEALGLTRRYDECRRLTAELMAQRERKSRS
ncbi:MAG: Eco57I restriction-modification methylase domain-containing protein [Candidatus Neomarinimicrobiota bacterium]